MGQVLLRPTTEIVTRDVTCFFYHSFSAGPIPHVTPLFACKAPEDLERDLLYLKERFPLVGHDDIVAHREGVRRLAPGSVALSFDDGFAECYSVARALLLKHAVPATFFVCEAFLDNRELMHRNKVALCLSRLAGASPGEAATLAARLRARFALASSSLPEVSRWLLGLDFDARAAIDAACDCLGIDVPAYLRERRPYMSREQIAQLHADGFTIGAHTCDHPLLGRLADWGEVRRQIRDSCEAVRAITGRDRVPLAFPFNGVDLPRERLRALREELGTIDLMYDTNNLMGDRDFIVNRICADPPPARRPAGSNLPLLLWRARALEPLRAVKRRLRGLPR